MISRILRDITQHEKLKALIVLLILVNFYQGGAIDTIQINDDLHTLDVQKHGYYYYLDETQSIGLSQASELQSCFIFKNDRTGFAPQKRNVWTLIQLEYAGSEDSKEVLLELSHAHIAQYDIFILAEGKLIYNRLQGDNFPFSMREIQHNFFLHRLVLEPNIIYQIYYKIDQEGQEVPFPLSIYDYGEFSKINSSNKLFHGFILGLCLIISLVTLTLYVVFKKRFYLIEVGVSISSIFYILAEEGYGLMSIWPNYPAFNGTSRPLFVYLMVALSLWFTIDFLKIRNQQPKAYMLSVFGVMIYTCYVVLFHPFNMLQFRTVETVGNIVSTFMIITALLSLLIIYLSVYAWRKDGNKDGVVIFGVFVITLILIVIRSLGIEGIFPDGGLIRHTGFITRALHVPIIGIYLVYNAIEALQESQNVKIQFLEEKSLANEKIVKSINEERRRVSMALHDSIGSTITGLKANFEMLDDGNPTLSQSTYYQEGMSMIKRLNDEVRTISNNLYPNTLQKLGLHEEIKRILIEVKTIHHIETHWEFNKNQPDGLDRDLQLQMYYILSEAIDNAVIHANPKNIWLQCNYYDDEINIIVEDDGIGFDIGKESDKGRNGLHNIRYRVKIIEGTIDIYSSIGNGTSITINIPY